MSYFGNTAKEIGEELTNCWYENRNAAVLAFEDIDNIAEEFEPTSFCNSSNFVSAVIFRAKEEAAKGDCLWPNHVVWRTVVE